MLRATTATSTLGNLTFAIAAAVNVVFMVRARYVPTTLGVVFSRGSVAALVCAHPTGPVDRVGPGLQVVSTLTARWAKSSM